MELSRFEVGRKNRGKNSLRSANAESDLRGNVPVLALDHHMHHIPRLVGPKCIGKIVEIFNLLPVEFDQDITGPQSGLVRGAPAADVGKTNAIFDLSEIGNGTEIGPIPSATTCNRMNRFARVDILGPLLQLIQACPDSIYESQNPRPRLGINLVPCIRRLVIVRVEAREKRREPEFFLRQRRYDHWLHR